MSSAAPSGTTPEATPEATPEHFVVGAGARCRTVRYVSIWLNLCQYELTELPPELLDCRRLEVLSAKFNRIERIPPLPPTVRRLWLSFNRLKRLENLPPDLEELCVENNCIEELREEDLPPYLRKLSIKNNPLAKRPAAAALIEDVNSGRRAARNTARRALLDFLSCCPSVARW